MQPASLGSPASQLSMRSRTAPSTSFWAPVVASRSLVWPTNSGSGMNTEIIAEAEPITSSRVIEATRLLPTSSPWARRPRVTAAQNPASWVPPWGVGMVLQ